MLTHIKVTPLAAESFGVRSMCTFVETPDVKVLLDAGVSLCPYRFGLPPNPIEFQAINRLRKCIAEAAEQTEVVTISHYHFDHHTPSYTDWLVNWTETGETAQHIYQGKTVIIKNPRENISASQRQRAWMFQKTGGKHAKAIETADGKSYTYGETVLRFSEAVSHGPDGSMLGWVVMVTVGCDGERFMFAPDVQGPMSTRSFELIMEEKPQMLIVGGPPFYLGGFKVDELDLQLGLRHLERLAEVVPLIVLEHHALRGEQWHQNIEHVYTKANQAGHEVMTAAEFLGTENVFLESKRKQLYVENPPSKEFEQWMRLNATEISRSKPPV